MGPDDEREAYEYDAGWEDYPPVEDDELYMYVGYWPGDEEQDGCS